MFLMFKKNYIDDIENSFDYIKSYLSNPEKFSDLPDTSGINKLIESSEKLFPYKFKIHISYPKNNTDQFFGMSVYPDVSTVDNIINAVISGGSIDSVYNLWKSNKVWTIDFDSRLFDTAVIDLTAKELTAIYCHELGHIISSNSVPSRISNILQFEIAKNNVTNKNILKDKFFNKILRLPIFNSCGMNSDSINEELKADRFAVKAGYRMDLVSALRKFQNCKLYDSTNPSKAMEQMVDFSINAIEQFKRRETSLLESTLINMKENCASGVLSDIVTEVYDNFFNTINKSEVSKLCKQKFIYEKVDKYSSDDFIALEFFGIPKNLKRIEPYEIDYITIKMKDIRSNNDKLMLITYAYSKLDIIQYYISILKNPVKSKKYRIPYSMDELISLKEHLTHTIDAIINYKIPNDLDRGLLVAWPEGYDG